MGIPGSGSDIRGQGDQGGPDVAKKINEEIEGEIESMARKLQPSPYF